MTANVADPTVTPPGSDSAATVDHSHDYDPDVVVTNPLGGLSVWQCRCGTSSLGTYLDPGNARAGFLAHKYGLPWPTVTSLTRPAAPPARRPLSHRVVNWLVFGGGAGMILLSVVPPLSALCLLIAVAGLVAMAVQYPSRRDEHRRRNRCRNRRRAGR